MKKILVSLLLLTATLCSTAAFANNTLPPNSKTVDLLFVQLADSGLLVPIQDKSGYYQLNLTGVKAFIGYFSDRPQRISGLYPTAQFIAKWDAGKKSDSFNRVPPNVVLHAVISGPFETKMINLPLQLSQPTYDANTKTLQYTAQVLPGVKVKVPSSKMDNVTLFIDSYDASASGHQS